MTWEAITLNNENVIQALEDARRVLMKPQQPPVAIISSYLYYWPLKSKHRNWKSLERYFRDKRNSENFRKILQENWWK